VVVVEGGRVTTGLLQGGFTTIVNADESMTKKKKPSLNINSLVHTHTEVNT